MDAEKVPVLKEIKGQEEQKEVSVAETVEEDTGTKEVPVPEEIKTQEEQKETSKPTADDTATEQVETQESVPKEEEREPQPPTFVKKLPDKIDLKDGEDLLLQCITDGLPKPEGKIMYLGKTKLTICRIHIFPYYPFRSLILLLNTFSFKLFGCMKIKHWRPAKISS